MHHCSIPTSPTPLSIWGYHTRPVICDVGDSGNEISFPKAVVTSTETFLDTVHVYVRGITRKAWIDTVISPQMECWRASCERRTSCRCGGETG